jgi:hypothetical protein
VSRPIVELLEDRLVLSSATQLFSTLNIVADPGAPSQTRPILLQVDPADNTKLDVFDTATVLGKFTISSIKNVIVTVTGNDAIIVNDSNGLPFAPGTTIVLAGSGPNNSLNPVGSRAINSSEVFTAGTPDSLALGGSLFQFSTAIASVTDEVVNAGQLEVKASGQAVVLTGSNGLTEQFTGLAGSSGSTLTFADKGFVSLELRSDGATATLSGTAAAQGLKALEVRLFGAVETLTVDATPSNVTTQVGTIGFQDRVSVRGNSGRVSIFGGSFPAVVTLGSNPTDASKSVTSGIKNDVFVFNEAELQILNGGNVTTNEQMTVTESTISGTGMFGNNNVAVHYFNTVPFILTGQLANSYTVAASLPGARFREPIFLRDEFSGAGLSVKVSVDSGSGLSLNLFNKNPASGSLFISALSGTFNPFTPTTPNGNESVTFTGLTSTIGYAGFDNVGHS